MNFGSIRHGFGLLAAALAAAGFLWFISFSGDDWWWLVLISLGVSVVAGVGRSRWRRAPWALGGLVIAVYLGVVAWMGIDAGRFPAGEDQDRIGFFAIWAIFFGMVAAWLLTCIALGALLAGRLRRLGGQ